MVKKWKHVVNPTSPPVFSAGSVNSLLSGCSSMDGGHQTLQDAIVVMDHLETDVMFAESSADSHHSETNMPHSMVAKFHLSKGCQAVGGAGGVGDNLHVLVVASLVHTHHKHRRVGRGGRDDDLRYRG